MKLNFRPIQKEDVLTILTWQYEPPYHIYDIGFEGFSAEEEIRYFLDPAFSFYAIVSENGELAGYCSFGKDGQVPGGDYAAEALDIGLGVRPDLTGKGLGTGIVTAVITFAAEQFKPTQLRVTIADFNKRAMRVWQKNGFQPVYSFKSQSSEMPFTIFTKEIG